MNFQVAFSHAQANGTTAHSHAHNAKSSPLGNSLSDTTLYSHISAAHSAAHTAIFPNKPLFLTWFILLRACVHFRASFASHSQAATCAMSHTHLVILYVALLVFAHNAFQDISFSPKSI
jgi:hypothetical protein